MCSETDISIYSGLGLTVAVIDGDSPGMNAAA